MNTAQPKAYFRTLLGILSGNRTFGGPLQANLSLTNRCNIRCHHCYYHSPFAEIPSLRPVRSARLNGINMPDDIERIRSLQAIDADDSKMKRLLDELFESGTFRFHISGGGEPFMHENALEYIERIKNAGRECTVNTNGLLLSKSTVDRLIETGCDELKITVMAGDEETYLKTHSGLAKRAFESLEHNLSYLSEKKRSREVTRPKVTVVCIITRENMDGLLQVSNFAGKVGANSMHYRSMDDAGDEKLRQLIPFKEQISEIRKQLETAGVFLAARKIDHNIEALLRGLKEKLDTSSFYRVSPCYYGWLSVSIDADGLLYFCCRAYMPLGNVFNESFHDVWDTRLYRLRRTAARHIPDHGKSVPDCDCNACIHHAANFKVFKLLHPLRARKNSEFRRDEVE